MNGLLIKVIINPSMSGYTEVKYLFNEVNKNGNKIDEFSQKYFIIPAHEIVVVHVTE